MNQRQQLFVANYLKTRNASAAARAAGYATASASVTGSKLLRSPMVAAAIAAHEAKTEKTNVSLAEKAMTELSTLRFGNLQDCFDADGNLLPISKMPREVAATLTAFENSKGFQRIKQGSKLSALELLSKITQLQKADSEQKTNIQIIVSQQAELPPSLTERAPILPV